MTNDKLFNRLFFVDVEATWGKASPATGVMTEFGAVHFVTRKTFHGIGGSKETMLDFAEWVDAVAPGGAMFVSDNPAFDWQWISFAFDGAGLVNPFGFSARRIGDFYAGLVGDFSRANEWKSLRVTTHDHMPVNDAMGNAEAFARMLNGERGKRR